MLLTERSIMVLLCVMNMVNYIDRGIIPGAPETFQGFAMTTLKISVSEQSLYFGLLASAFILSYSVFSMVFGYLSISRKPFHVIAYGMSVWCIAVFCCGLAKSANSYWILFLGRFLSGIGEASFQCTAMPFINEHAPASTRTLWMGFFLISVTVGTAVGYIYGAMLAATSLGWPGAFFLEGLVMIVLILVVIYGVPEELNQVPVKTGDHNESEGSALVIKHSISMDGMLEPGSPQHSYVVVGHVDREREVQEVARKAQPFFREVFDMFKNVTFTLVVLGHAAHTFTVAGMSVFCPILLIGLGLFEGESEVSFAFGALVAGTGIIGTLAGSVLLDKITKSKQASHLRCSNALLLVLISMVVGLALSLVAYMTLPSKSLFLGIFALAFLCIFAVSPCEAVAVMELFPASRRGFAVAVNTLVIHALGDVPSPIVLGWLKDAWAPSCGTVVENDKLVLNPACEQDRSGLKHVLLLAILWFIWAVVMWALALRHHAKTSAKTN